MSPTEQQEAGMTLVEVMISIAISMLLAAGGYQMLTRSQKYLAYKKIDQTAQNEVDQFLNVVKKSWDYRMREGAPGIPTSGEMMLTGTGVECLPGGATPCPKLRVWMKRVISGATITNRVTIENICQVPLTKEITAFISSFNYATFMNANCHSCPKGQIPAIQITGVNEATGVAVLVAENRIFPMNASKTNLDKVSFDNVLGMQACFTQPAANSALTIDLRAVVRDQSAQTLRLVKKNQVFPFENFAGIRLEQ